jgi:FixJ family two-component response regulator
MRNPTVVYVIDDDASVRKALARLMRSANIDAETFSSPGEFLAIPRREENACMIADMRMPGATGLDLQHDLALRGIGIPVIVVSASDDPAIRDRARDLGAVAFFRKPVDDHALLDAIWWALSAAREKTKERNR